MKSELCMEMNLLAEYIGGHLSDKERDRTERHLAACDECLEEYMSARSLLEDKELIEYDPGPLEMVRTVLQAVGERLKKKISEWIAGFSAPVWILQHEPSPVRSGTAQNYGGASLCVKKDFDDLKTEMYIENAGDNTARIWVTVFKAQQVAKNISLTLIREGELPFARILNRERGHVLFDKQPFGHYTLMLEQNTPETGSQAVPFLFEITDAGFYEREYDLS